jgi:membrane protease YdiL (CAAX protease family)
MFFVVWGLRATVFFAVDEFIASPMARAAYSNLLKLILWVLPAAVFGWRLRSTPPARYLGCSVMPSLRNWLLYLAVTSIFLLAATLLSLTLGGKSFSAVRLMSLSTLLGLLQFVISPLLEELLFRGMVMKELLTLLPTYLANGLTSLLFVGAHLPYWLSHVGPTPAMMVNSVGVFAFSILACWLFAKSDSIWPPTVAHIANNILSSMLVQASCHP